MTKTSFNVLLLSLGLTFGSASNAQLRVKPYVQSGVIGTNDYLGEGVDLTWVQNPEKGYFFTVSTNKGKAEETPGVFIDRGFSMQEISIGQTFSDGLSIFAGNTTNKLKFSRPTYDWDLNIEGLFGGIGYSFPVASGVLSASGSIMGGSISGIYLCRPVCINVDNSLDSKVSGFAIAIAFAYPVSETMVIGVENKYRSYSFDYFGSEDQIGYNLTRIFVDLAF